MSVTTYFKSFEKQESGFETRTFDKIQDAKVTCQTIEEVLKSNIFKPNTDHSKLIKRLCVSALSKEYSGSYRPEGILFETNEEADYCCPVDLLALANSETFSSTEYDTNFIKGFQDLICGFPNSIEERFPNREVALKKVNELRKKANLPEIAEPFSYNECCFMKQIKIKPTGIVGTSQEMIQLAQKYNLPIYKSTEEFVKEEL